MRLRILVNQTEGIAMMLVTHDAVAASYCHRVIFIKDGQLFNEINYMSNRQDFFQKIIDVLSLLGGDTNDLSTIRV